MHAMMTIIARKNPTSIATRPLIKPIVTNELESLMTNSTLVDTVLSDMVGVGCAAHPSPMDLDINLSEEKINNRLLSQIKLMM